MKNIWGFFLNKYKFTLILTLVIVVFGVVSVFQLPKESNPDVDIPVVNITTAFPGASAIDVEQLVTNRIEDRITSLNEVDNITSRSQSGVSSITVEFNPDASKRTVVDDLESEIDDVESELPEDAKQPKINETELSDRPFMQVSVGGPYSIVELTDFVNKVKDEVNKISGVSEVELVGDQDKEVQVVISRTKLNNFSLGARDVTEAISQANSDIPIGDIETSGENFNLRLSGRINNVDEIGSIPVANKSGSVVLVEDVAEIRAAVSEKNSISRLSKNSGDPKTAITLLIYDSPGGDITEISKSVEKRIQSTVNNLPTDVEYVVIENQGEIILDDLSSLSKNGLATVSIIFLILFFILGLREAVMASIAIPLSFLMTFTFLYQIGYSLNFMTLFSLILALGIIVDTAIVINEGISRKIDSGQGSFTAARAAIKEFQWPLIAGTLTTVFAFVPMLLTGGTIGEFIKSIPVTVSVVLVSSLFIALAVVTTVNAVFANWREKDGFDKKDGYLKAFAQRAEVWYENKLKGFLRSGKKRKKFTLILFAVAVFSYSLPFLGVLDINMFPPEDRPKFTIEVEAPIGTTISNTSKIVEQIEDSLQQDNRISSYVANIGSSIGSSGQNSSNKANLTINLKENSDRESSLKIIEQYQGKFDSIGRADISITQTNTGPEQEAPVVVTVSGKSLDQLDKLAKKFKRELEKIAGTRNTGSTVKDTNGEFVIDLDRNKAKRLGISTSQLAGLLRNMINGRTATSINQEGEDIDIAVKSNLSERGDITYRTDIETIRSLSINTPSGSVPLSSLAEIKLQNNRVEINHEDGNRIAKATSYTKEGTTAADIFNKIETKIDQGEFNIPAGYEASLGGENEDIQESFSDMFRAMILAVFLITSLLILQFDSFKQAFIVLTTIPLALIGVFPGLAALGLPLSFPGIIGIVALVGIVVNNAILLVDTINRKRKELSMDKSILEAGKERVRPIVLTTITTVLGILPLALTEKVWMSLGFSLIFGLLFSTVLTLLVVPLLYKKIITS